MANPQQGNQNQLPTAPQSPLTASDVQQAVASEISAQMKPILSHLGREIGQGISQAMEAHTPKKVPFGRYDPQSVYHPSKVDAKRFTRGRTYFQCGVRLSESNCFDNEVHLLNQISHTGMYVDGNVAVVVRKNGEDEEVSVSWPCHTADIRSDMKNLFRNFKECLELVLAGQQQEREKMAAQERFDKRYQDATGRAEASA